jgi:hypothetical protein
MNKQPFIINYMNVMNSDRERSTESEVRQPMCRTVSPLQAEMIIREQFGSKLKPVTKPLDSRKVGLNNLKTTV